MRKKGVRIVEEMQVKIQHLPTSDDKNPLLSTGKAVT